MTLFDIHVIIFTEKRPFKGQDCQLFGDVVFTVKYFERNKLYTSTTKLSYHI